MDHLCVRNRIRRSMDHSIEPSDKLQIALHAKKEINKYPAKAHCQRVAAKLDLEKALIVLQGEKTKYFSNSDQYRPFRQDRYFYYLTGCNEPGCFVTYDIDEDKLVLWLPPINLARVYVEGRGSTIEEAMELYDIDDAYYITGNGIQSNLATELKNFHEAGGKCLFMKSVKGILDQRLRVKLKRQDRPGLRLRQAMDACRAVKDEYEIELVRQANVVSTEAHTNILKHLHALKSEPEVESVYIATCIALGSSEQAYSPICGSGSNASQLHYVKNNRKFGDSETLLVDAGAEWQCYASDVTRTMPINPKAPGTWRSAETKAVYEHVAKIQDECIAQLRPGKHFIDVVFHSIHLAIDALIDLGILKGDHMDIFHSGAAAGLYPHGLGHHVGLEVHDVPPPVEGKGQNRRFRGLQKAYTRFAEASPTLAANMVSNKPHNFSIIPELYRSPSTPSDPSLASGMIVTVEPGIYFNQFALETFYLNDPERSKFIDKEALKKYMHVGGVRIEDDILITKDGYENLTTAPKGEEMLKIIKEASK